VTRPGESAQPRTAERSRLRRILTVGGQIRPAVVVGISTLTTVVLVLVSLELAVVLLSLAGVGIFKYLLGSSFLSWLAHRSSL
jgi:hypothetical protein